MNSIDYSQISSLETILNSIRSDAQVNRWFTFLISQPAVRGRIEKHDDGRILYGQLRQSMMTQLFFYSIILGGLILIAYGILPLQVAALAIAFFVFTFIWFTKKTRKTVITLSSAILTDEFTPDELKTKTLYQISEHFSMKLSIPSLVDVLYSFDTILRKSLIFLILINCYVIPSVLTLWQTVMFIIATYFLIITALNTTAIYKHLS